MCNMIREEIADYRLFNQRVTGQQLNTPEAVVKWMGAVQAQDYRQALWAVGVRMQAAAVADVESAIADARIVRTWPMRGTIHFVPAEDVKWMLILCASRILAGHGRRIKQLGLINDIMARCETLFTEALAGLKMLTRGTC